MARIKPNIYLEMSMWQYSVKYIEEFVFAIDRMRNDVGIERILWGSDLPGTLHLMSLKEWADTFRRLPAIGEEHGLRFDDSDVSALMGDNGARILKLG